MVNKLTKLYNTLMLVETKGENTKIMAQCLQYLEQMVNEEQIKSAKNSTDEPNNKTT